MKIALYTLKTIFIIFQIPCIITLAIFQAPLTISVIILKAPLRTSRATPTGCNGPENHWLGSLILFHTDIMASHMGEIRLPKKPVTALIPVVIGPPILLQIKSQIGFIIFVQSNVRMPFQKLTTNDRYPTINLTASPIVLFIRNISIGTDLANNLITGTRIGINGIIITSTNIPSIWKMVPMTPVKSWDCFKMEPRLALIPAAFPADFAILLPCLRLSLAIPIIG